MTTADVPPPAGEGRLNRALRRGARIPTPVIFIGAVLLAVALLLWRGSLRDVADAISDAALWPLAAGFVIFIAGLWLLAVRWHLLVRMVKGPSDLPRAAEAFLTSVVINYAAPIGLAVPSRAALTKRALGLGAAETGAIALWEVAADTAILGAMTVLWIALGGWDGALAEPLAGRGLLVAVAMAGGAILSLTALLVVLRKRPGLGERLGGMGKEIASFPLRRPAAAMVVLAVSAIYWALQVVTMAIFLDAFRVDVTFLLALGVIGLPVLVGMLSPVPGGAGIREALMVAIASHAGAPAAAVLVAALFYRIALFAAIPLLYGAVRIAIARNPAHGTIAETVGSPERGAHPEP